jgi:hypothetical protein
LAVVRTGCAVSNEPKFIPPFSSLIASPGQTENIIIIEDGLSLIYQVAASTYLASRL